MAAIGKRNTLRVVRDSLQGLYLDGEELGEILLPTRYVPRDTQLDSDLDVFIYRDSEDRLIATTETPLVSVGEFACLQVLSADPYRGAFLAWGLSKDLLLPIREQEHRVTVGERVVVFVYLDPHTLRIVASSRLNKHLNRTHPDYAEGQKVRLLIAGKTPLGYNAIVEHDHHGLLYHSELSTPLTYGQKLYGYVRLVREDGKIDLRLDPEGYSRVAPLTDKIMEALKANGGRLEFNDKSSPESIRVAFDTSKKAFKQALGALFRERRAKFERGGIELIE
jgi:predicted RNA-binding protein (virulence factor B family)